MIADLKSTVTMNSVLPSFSFHNKKARKMSPEAEFVRKICLF